jgi:hypothetical protein
MPGQCAWSDRAVQPSEPNLLCHIIAPGINISSSPVGRSVDKVTAPNAAYLDELRSDSRYVIFQAFNDGNGCMTVTGVGP